MMTEWSLVLTPTLVVPHRNDGFAEAIHSPQVAGLSTRFRFGRPEDLLSQASASHSDLGQLASQGGLRSDANMSDKGTVSTKEKEATEKRERRKPPKQPQEPRGSPTPKSPRGRPKASKKKATAKSEIQKATTAAAATGRKRRERPKKEEAAAESVGPVDDGTESLGDVPSLSEELADLSRDHSRAL